MKIGYMFGICLVCSLLIVAKSQGKSTGVIHYVGSDNANCYPVRFTSIQMAIDKASPGDWIYVCDGIYKETLHISKTITLIASAGAVLVPDTIPQNSESLTTGGSIAAAVYVSSAENVELSGLTIDGGNAGITGCAPDLVGVYFQNSSGHVKDLTIKNFRLGPGLASCQSGTGIFVQSGNGGTSTVEINNCVLHDFQKSGITANEVGTTVQIHDNIINGLGLTSGAAQNGIQIGFGARGAIANNTVSDELWSPCVSANCSSVGTGILIDAADGIVVKGNQVSHTQVGIFVNGNQTILDSNLINDSQVGDGIRIIGDRNFAHHNHIHTSGEAGILVSGTTNKIGQNIITDSPIGIFQTHPSKDNCILWNAFHAAAIPVQPKSAESVIELL